MKSAMERTITNTDCATTTTCAAAFTTDDAGGVEKLAVLPMSGYPVAGCVVQHKANLALVVRQLRSAGLLKRGSNVTPFRSCFRIKQGCEHVMQTNIDGMYLSFVKLYPRDVRSSFCTTHNKASNVHNDANDEVMQAWSTSQCVTTMVELLSSDASCFAVHTVGFVSTHLLKKLVGDGVVCIIPHLRLYSDACCSIDTLPSPLQVLRDVIRNTPNELFNRTTSKEASAFTFCELFAGIGMFRLGLEGAGGHCVFAVECAEPARVVYSANFDKDSHRIPLLGDITSIPSSFFPSHDILTAGFPCQSFAKAGPATGLQHEKGWLFFEVVRVLRATSPKGFLLENVEHLLHLDNGAQLTSVLQALREPGGEYSYSVVYRIIDGALVTPQRRRRVYFIGIRSDFAAEHLDSVVNAALAQLVSYRERHPGHSPRCVREILDCPPETGLQLTHAQWEAVKRSKTFRQNPHWRFADLSGTARTLMSSYRTHFQVFSEFVPLSEEMDEGTINAAKDEVPVRFYSVRECARLQGIPDSFHLAIMTKSTNSGVPYGALYRLVGNAVNPIIIECLGSALRCLICEQRDDEPMI